jgi:hypothetical protein
VQLLTDTGLTVFCDAGCIVGRGVAVGGSSVTRGVLVSTSNDCDGTAATSVGRSIMGSGVGGKVCDSEQALAKKMIPTSQKILRSIGAPHFLSFHPLSAHSFLVDPMLRREDARRDSVGWASGNAAMPVQKSQSATEISTLRYTRKQDKSIVIGR